MARRFPGSDVPASEPQSWLRRTLDRLTDYASGKYPLALAEGTQQARIIFAATPSHPDAVLQVQVAVARGATQSWRTLLWIDGAGNAVFRGAVTRQTDGWRPATPFALNDRVAPRLPNGHRYKATVAGVSGGTEPAWPTAAGGTVADGGATWAEDGAPPVLDMNTLGMEYQG